MGEEGGSGGVAGGERRRSRRYEVTEAGTLWHHEKPFSCMVKNLSAGGALVETGSNLPIGADIACIEGARLIPLGSLEGRLGEIADWREQLVVVHCHHGPRSRAACEILLTNGFARVENLTGGIDAWALAVDPGLARY